MFELSKDGERILYTSRRLPTYVVIPIKSIKFVKLNQQSKGFRRDPRPRMDHLSFTITYERSKGNFEDLDLICPRQTDFTVWTTALPVLIKNVKSGETLSELMVSVAINPAQDA